MRVLIDTNVFLDVILARTGLMASSKAVLGKIADGENQYFVTAKSVVDIYYHVRRKIGDVETRRVLASFLDNLFIIDTTDKDCRWALSSPVKDYEDAVLVESAGREEMDAIVTRNVKDFRGITIPVWTPEEAVGDTGGDIEGDLSAGGEGFSTLCGDGDAGAVVLDVSGAKYGGVVGVDKADGV